jgi:CRP-like cAMP-binding protein
MSERRGPNLARGSDTSAPGWRRIVDAFPSDRRSYAAKETLIEADDGAPKILLLRQGWAIRTRPLDGGRRVILTLYLPGDFIGLDRLVEPLSPDTVTAVTSASCIALDAAEIRRTIADPAVALGLLQEVDRERRRVENLTAGLARCSAEERLAAFLLDIDERLAQAGFSANGAPFRLPVIQQEIGDHLGLTVVHVNRVLRGLRESGVVTLRAGVVTIHDRDRLRKIAIGGEDETAPRAASA